MYLAMKRHLMDSVLISILQKKSKLTGYVVACGHQYGKGENLFHYFFKVDINVIITQYTLCLRIYCMLNLQYYLSDQVSWLMQFPKVPLFGQGTNYIPMIHVYDLGGWFWLTVFLHVYFIIRYHLFYKIITAELNCVPFSEWSKTSLNSSQS